MVAAYAAYGQDYDMHAGNWLHEAGHFMSLEHTTEGDGLRFDFIEDTAKCEIEVFDGRDNLGVEGQQDGEITDHECGIEGGANNFIFFAGHPDFLPFFISEDQAWVMRSHPLFKPVSQQ